MTKSEIISLLISPIFGLFGVWLGSILSKRNSVKLEKQFYIKKIRIEKNQEITNYLYDFLRIIGRTQSNVVKYLSNDINHADFKLHNDNVQDSATDAHRALLSNTVFLSEELNKEYTKLYDTYGMICSKIYEKYHYPETPDRHFSDDQIKWKNIQNDFINCLSLGMDIIDKMNHDLNDELKELE